MTAREILQYFGTEIMRDNFDENVWVNSMKNKVKSTLTKNNQKMFVFVPDIRYVSESVHMDYLVDIYRKEAEIANKDGHKSEKSGMLIPDESISFSVVNDGTLKELKEKAIFFCENILLKDELWSLNKSEGTTLGGIV
jgi:hypothetical protein